MNWRMLTHPMTFGAVALVVVAAIFFISGERVQANGEINAGRDGVAIQGYDTVAYFTQRKAVRGSPDFEVKWKNVTWRFASAENRARFKGSPERFAPQFGGY